MPALVGTCWSDDAWSADAWAADTWAAAEEGDTSPASRSQSHGFGYFYSAVLFLLGHILMRG